MKKKYVLAGAPLPYQNVCSFSGAFRTLCELPDIETCVNMQGMAMDGDILYAFKVARDNSLSVLHRVDIKTGEFVRMTESELGTQFIPYLHHANDACAARWNGKTQLFVATMDDGCRALVQLEIDGDGFRKVASYTLLTEDGTDLDISAVEIRRQEGSRITFFFNKENDYWQGELDLAAPEDSLQLHFAFSLDLSHVLLDGDMLSMPLDTWYWQGVAVRGKWLYSPRTHGSTTAFLAFDVSSPEGILQPDPEESFSVTDHAFRKLEAEGLGFDAEGHMYFNTNRRNSDGPHHDGIHVLRRMVF